MDIIKFIQLHNFNGYTIKRTKHIKNIPQSHNTKTEIPVKLFFTI